MPSHQPSLEQLAQSIKHCRACRLHLNRTNAVPGEGPSRPRIMLIGEAPGEQEDRLARPFIGPTRKFFDQLLHDFSLPRGEIFITSSVKCRPPNNRDPKDDELATCRKLWLEKQILSLDPEILVLLGATALRCLFGSSGKLKHLHGTVRQWNSRSTLLTYHPTAGMRFPWIRKSMYEDLARLQSLLADPT